MLHNPFIEDPNLTDCGTAPTKTTQCTSASPLPSKMVRPEDCIKAIKRRMTNPVTNKKIIQIEVPSFDPTIRKKPRYEHSFSRLIKKNPRVTSTVLKIQQKCDNDNHDIAPSQEPGSISPEHVDNNSNNSKNEPICILDSISSTSSSPPIDIPEEMDIESENKLLLIELEVSDSEDEVNQDCTSSIKDSTDESNDTHTDQCSISDNTSEKSQTEQLIKCDTEPNPYTAEPKQPVPPYIPTPKHPKEEKRRRAVRYIPVAEWMFDQWRIISKANQAVGDAMRDAMIKEGLLHARK